MTAFDIAQSVLLMPAELTVESLRAQLHDLSSGDVDLVDFYFQDAQVESWFLENQIVKTGSYHVNRGVGIRVIGGESTGFAYANDVNLASVATIGAMAKQIVRYQGNGCQRVIVKQQPYSAESASKLYPSLNPIMGWSADEKVDLLKRLDVIARAQDNRVKRVTASLNGGYKVILVMASDGTLVADVRPLVRLNVNVIVESHGRQESGNWGGGVRGSYDYFLEDDRAFSFAKAAVRQALINLEAIDAPAGSMPVVLASGWPGILLHEAIGHGLEGDANRKKTSAFYDKMGERIASPLCTIVDDSLLANRRGSLQVDDEGTEGQYTVLIEKGILKGFMQDKLNARLMKTQSTGNGRRESYASIPIPRMTNTYMLPGEYEPEEIIASVDHGVYAVNFSGGQVDVTSGKFVFSASEAYLIEKGKITHPIKGATLIGSGPEVLTKVSMVGNDLQWDAGIGSCGKDGQSVPVGVGQPTLKVDELTVGGTAN